MYLPTREVVAMVSSLKDGPPTRVERICSVRIEGGDFTDELELVHLTGNYEPIRMRGSTIHDLPRPMDPGIVQVRRASGGNPVSVYISTF